MEVSKTIDYIVSWLLDYSNQSKTKGFVVGVSGGIDSAVTSTLCAKTGKSVIALNMHIRQKPEQFKLAETQISFLKKHFGYGQLTLSAEDANFICLCQS